MTQNKDNKQKEIEVELNLVQEQVARLEQELQNQRQIAYAAGLFQADVTVRTLLESLAEGIIVVDKNGCIVLINTRAGEMFGYPPHEPVGQPLTIFLPERFIASHPQSIQNFFKNPRIRPMGQGLDLMGKRKDGSEFPIEISLSYLQTEVGILGLAFVTNIAARKQAEWALKIRNEELDAFAHTVAHDLKTSLSTLIAFSEMLADTHNTLSEQERNEYITALAQNGRRMSNIIDELLVFASIRKEDVIHVPLPMKGIVDHALQRLHFMVKEYNAEITIPDKFPTALGHISWVEEVWFNYLVNAIKYGGTPPVIEIGSNVEQEYIKFWVRDNGQGILNDKKLKLFKPFVNVSSPKFEGQGLGLSIVKQIVDKLNGKISVESETGKGSTFSFYLMKNGE